MYSVIVLLDSENRYSNFLRDKNLGNSTELSMLCRQLTPAELNNKKVYNYEIFGLFTLDKKVNDYLSTQNGIIIVIDCSNLTNMIINNRINNVIRKYANIPIAIVFEFTNDHELKFAKTYSNKLINSHNLKLFYVPKTMVFTHGHTSHDVNRWITQQMKLNNQNNNKIITSKNIDSYELIKQFEQAELPLHVWDHYGRLRIVWISLTTFGYNNTINKSGWLCKNWKKYKTSIGHGDKWNYTLTVFWTNYICNLQQKYNYTNFDDLYNSNEEIHYGLLFKKYYDEQIFSEYAKNNWMSPNLKKLDENTFLDNCCIS